MSDKNIIALAEIRNGYALNKYGNLTLEKNSLIKYDNLCLNLIKEIQELKKQLEEKNNSQIFIDTQDMEERYAEGLYMDYLKEENKQLKDRINKAGDLLKLLHYLFPDYDDIHNRIEDIERILKEDNKEEI